MKELRFPAAACSVSSEELEQLSLSAVCPVLAFNLLRQLLEAGMDFVEDVQLP